MKENGVGHCFDKSARIRKRGDFVRLSGKSCKISSRYFVALYEKKNSGNNRLGITVTKRVGNAVTRNRLKRYVREFYRHRYGGIENVMDLIIIAKKEASDIPSHQAYESLQQIFEKIRKIA